MRQNGLIKVPSPTKKRITIRLDKDVSGWFQSQVHEGGGENDQTPISDALREHINGHGHLEPTLQCGVRDDLI